MVKKKIIIKADFIMILNFSIEFPTLFSFVFLNKKINNIGYISLDLKIFCQRMLCDVNENKMEK